WDLVEALRAAGVAVILSTHHMEEAERLADHVVIIDHGTAVASGTPAELTGGQREIRFFTDTPLETSALAEALPAGTTVSSSTSGGRHHHTLSTPGSPGSELLATVTAWCASADVLPEALRVHRRTLEAVFLDLTGRALRTRQRGPFRHGRMYGPTPSEGRHGTHAGRPPQPAEGGQGFLPARGPRTFTPRPR